MCMVLLWQKGSKFQTALLSKILSSYKLGNTVKKIIAFQVLRK